MSWTRKIIRRINREKAGQLDTGKLTCAFIIRFHYPETDPRFEWRLKYFKEAVLPRIRAQTDKRFDVCVRCNPAHDKIFKNLGCKPFQVKKEYADYVLSEDGRSKFFYDFVKWEDCLGLEQYDIQIGLDSDDLIAPNYIERIKSECARSKKSLHIHFQPEELVLTTREIRPHVEQFKDTGSMFLALYYPDKSVYHHCYETSHRSLSKLAARSVCIPSGYCWLTIHDQNESTRRKFKAEELKGVKSWAERPWAGEPRNPELARTSEKDVRHSVPGYRFGMNKIKGAKFEIRRLIDVVKDPDRNSLVYITCNVPVFNRLLKRVLFRNRILIYYWREDKKQINLGDYIGKVFLDRFGYKSVPYSNASALRSLGKYDFCLLIVGSLLNKQWIDWLSVPQVYVWGQGKGFGEYFDMKSAPYNNKVKIFAVRGPHTLRQLNLSEKTPVGDPAFLMPLFFKIEKDPAQYKVTYIPHHSNREGWTQKKEEIGAERYVDIMCSRRRFWPKLREIVSSKFVLTSTLHTAIICQAYGVPWALCLAEEDKLNFPDKWKDFFEYLGIDGQENAVRNYGQGLKWWEEVGSKAKTRDLRPLLNSFPLPIKNKEILDLMEKIKERENTKQ